MKKTFVLILLSLFLISCSQKNESKEEKRVSEETEPDREKFAPAVLNAGSVFLAYKFKARNSFKYRLTSISSTDETIKGDTLLTNKFSQTADYIFDFTVKNKTNDSTFSLGVKISKINLISRYNDQTIQYKSDSIMTSENHRKFVEYESILNTPFEIILTRRGLIKEVKGLEKMADKLITSQNPSQQVTDEDRKKVIDYLKFAAITPLTQLIFRIMPEKKVAKESTWDEKYSSNLGNFNIMNKITFKLLDFVKLGDGIGAKISASLSTSHSGDKKGSEQGINYEFDDPKMEGSGIIIFDVDTGLLHSSSTTTHLETKVKMEGKDSRQKTRSTIRTENSTNKNIVELL